MGMAKADDPHHIPSHGKNHDVGFAIAPVSQSLIPVLAVVIPRVPPNDGAFPVEQRRVGERQAALTDIPGVLPRVVAMLHALM